ncbi:unnamed protein product [Medioppia subpectinata]|uniref:Lipase domain-containing protein n=1 Tax=Medioppia subpectinata TaxID=1979941 RepID=A0A7R9PUK1_9ACAR|nr:unnamed protein product [Medioppia subpectinata]CAG2101627.1 unnamed protein product [Medioppia subpectinata]
MKDLFFDQNYNKYNIILVAWGKGAKISSYYLAAANTQVVGGLVAYFINRLCEIYNIKNDMFSLIGHSLGAHVMGQAGRRLYKPRVARITGLDPAGPGFRDDARRLNRNDASLVIILHTDISEYTITEGLGQPLHSGHVDFFPNGGKLQPGCASSRGILNAIKAIRADEQLSCSHLRACDLGKSLGKRGDMCLPVGYRCSDWEDFIEGRCADCGHNNSKCFLMGLYPLYWMGVELPAEHKLNSSTFQYFLNTEATEDFCSLHISKESVQCFGSIAISIDGLVSFSDNPRDVTIERELSPTNPGAIHTLLVTFDYYFRQINGVSVKWNRNQIKSKVYSAVEVVNYAGGDDLEPFIDVQFVEINYMSHIYEKVRTERSAILCPVNQTVLMASDDEQADYVVCAPVCVVRDVGCGRRRTTTTEADDEDTDTTTTTTTETDENLKVENSDETTTTDADTTTSTESDTTTAESDDETTTAESDDETTTKHDSIDETTTTAGDGADGSTTSGTTVKPMTKNATLEKLAKEIESGQMKFSVTDTISKGFSKLKGMISGVVPEGGLKNAAFYKNYNKFVQSMYSKIFQVAEYKEKTDTGKGGKASERSNFWVTVPLLKNILGKTCFDDIGCFSAMEYQDFTRRPIPLLPMAPEFIQATFHVFTLDNKLKPQNFRAMVPLYHLAATNTRVVGAMLAYFVTTLTKTFKIKNDKFWLIGHSLGGQTVGYAGKRLNNPQVFRITGLDPAGPGFHYENITMHLDKSDATFVDVWHTDSAESFSEGMGSLSKRGHLDFFPNGGLMQPGCKTSRGIGHIIHSISSGEELSCSHTKANIFPISLGNNLTECMTIAYDCQSYETFIEGRFYHYQFGIHVNEESDPSTGVLDFTLKATVNNTERSLQFERYMTGTQIGEIHSFLITFEFKLSDITSMTLTWNPFIIECMTIAYDCQSYETFIEGRFYHYQFGIHVNEESDPSTVQLLRVYLSERDKLSFMLCAKDGKSDLTIKTGRVEYEKCKTHIELDHVGFLRGELDNHGNRRSRL